MSPNNNIEQGDVVLTPFARVVAHSGWRNVGRGQSLALSEDGRLLATGTGRGEIAVWDVTGDRKNLSCRWWGTVHQLWVADMTFVKVPPVGKTSNTDNYLISASGDGSVGMMKVKRQSAGRKNLVLLLFVILVILVMAWFLELF